MLAEYVAGQLRAPSGIVGRLVLAPLWNRMNSALNDVAFDSLDLCLHDRVLEVGFGGGYLLGRIAAIVTSGYLAGVDASQSMVAYCEWRHRPLIEAGRLELRCTNAESLPYASVQFTRACSVNSLFYWADAPQAMAEMYRVLGEGGRLVICVTCKGCIESREFARHGLALLEDEDLCRLMEAVGFSRVTLSHASDRHREFACIIGMR
jgi:SAM-dependent methyltransferase